MIKVTDNKEVKETVLAGLKRNKEKYGKKYCPCSLVRDEDTICMCKEFREMEEGTCHCQIHNGTKDLIELIESEDLINEQWYKNWKEEMRILLQEK